MTRRDRPRRPVPAPAAPAPRDAAPEDAPVIARVTFDSVIGFLARFIAPATLLTGLLFYFGYVSSRAYFAYFGIDVDLLQLTNQGFVMRSPGALLLPVMVILSLSAALIVVHRRVRRWMRAVSPGRAGRLVFVIGAIGTVLVIVGLALAALYGPLAGWGPYAFLTPFLLAVGAGFCAYSAAQARALRGGGEGLGLVVLLVLVVAAGGFWTTATVAQWWGRGEARTVAADLSTLPAVVLDTQERLYPGNSAITVQRLDEASAATPDAEQGQTPTFRYRYYGLRLLVQGGGRLFLVPDAWSADASTLVVPFDDAVRLRFRFFPDEDPPT